MIIEFQISREKLETLLHNRLLALRPCVTSPFQYDDEMYYVAKITLDATSIIVGSGTRLVTLYQYLPETQYSPESYLLSAINVPPLRVAQQAVAHVVTRTSLTSANQSPPPLLPVTLSIVFDLAITFDEAHVPRLCATVQAVNVNLPDQAAKQQLEDFVKTNVVSCREVNLDSIAAATKSAVPEVVNAGIALHQDGQRVAIRLDTSHADISYWPTFYAGSFSSLASDRDWAVLVPKELMLPPAVQHVKSSLLEAEVDGKFSLDSGPDGAWTISGSEPHATITVSGEVIDACIDIDLNVDVTLSIVFSVPSPGTLRTTVTLDVDSNNSELFWCEFVTATAWPFVGAVMLSEEKIEWWMYLAGLAVGPLVIFNGLVGYLSSDAPASHIPEAAGWVEVSDTERYQDMSFPTSLGGLVGGITLKAVSASGAGLLLAGSAAPPNPALCDLTIDSVSNFDWQLFQSCTKPAVVANAGIYWHMVCGPGVPVPAHLCHVEVLDDPLGQYADLRLENGDIRIVVPLPLKPGFVPSEPDVVSEPGVGAYPCKVLILTTDGARLITIPPPPPPPEYINDPLWPMTLKLWKLIHCTRYDSIWDQLHMLNPEWLIDPPPEQEVAQSWAVTISDMSPGEAFVLRDAGGLELVTVFANASGFASATAMVEHSSDRSIVIARPGPLMTTSEFRQRSAELSAPEVPPRQSVSVKQTLLVRSAAIALDGVLERLSFTQYRGAPTVFVATDAGIAAYDLARPSHPQRISVRRQPVEWEAAPSWVIRRLAHSSVSCGAAEVRDAINRGRFTYVLHEHLLDVIDSGGCSIGSIDVSDAISITTAGDLVVVATKEGLTVFDGAMRDAWREPSRIVDTEVRGVVQAKLAYARHAVYVRGRGHSGRVLDMANPGRPAELAQHSERPWYVDGGQLGRLLVRTANDDRHVIVYRVASSLSGWELPPTVEDVHKSARSHRASLS